MGDWQAVLLALGGLALFVLILYGAVAIASGFLNRDHLGRPRDALRGWRRTRR